MARLPCQALTVRINVENSNRAKDGVCVQASSAVVHIDIGHYVGAVPETLKEAEEFRRLVAACACHMKNFCELRTFNKSSILILEGEETRSVSFFPQVEPSLVPVLPNV